MQCSEFEKPVKTVEHDMICTVKAKLDFVNVFSLLRFVSDLNQAVPNHLADKSHTR